MQGGNSKDRRTLRRIISDVLAITQEFDRGHAASAMEGPTKFSIDRTLSFIGIAMAIVLYFEEKAPITVSLMVTAMTAVLIHPAMHVGYGIYRKFPRATLTQCYSISIFFLLVLMSLYG
jgi:hypothetical protein